MRVDRKVGFELMENREWKIKRRKIKEYKIGKIYQEIQTQKPHVGMIEYQNIGGRSKMQFKRTEPLMNLKLAILIVLFIPISTIGYAQTSSDKSEVPTAPIELNRDGTVPATPTAPTVSNNVNGHKTLTCTIPPSGDVWYWQTTARGTDRSNSNVTYTVSEEGTRNIFLRAYRPSNGLWSGAVAQSVTVTKSSPER